MASYKMIIENLIFQLVNEIKSRLPPSIPINWFSERFLVRCLERKEGGLRKGEVASFRDEWGREGTKEVLSEFDTKARRRIVTKINNVGSKGWKKNAGGFPLSS